MSEVERITEENEDTGPDDDNEFRGTFIEIGWCDGGPMFDFLSVERDNDDDSFSTLCINSTLAPFKLYVEILGTVIVNTYEED